MKMGLEGHWKAHEERLDNRGRRFDGGPFIRPVCSSLPAVPASGGWNWCSTIGTGSGSPWGYGSPNPSTPYIKKYTKMLIVLESARPARNST